MTYNLKLLGEYNNKKQTKKLKEKERIFKTQTTIESQEVQRD